MNENTRTAMSPALSALGTPCHGEPLVVSAAATASGYDAHNVVDEIGCPAEGCTNS